MASGKESEPVGFLDQKFPRRAFIKKTVETVAFGGVNLAGLTSSEYVQPLGILPESRTIFPIGMCIHRIGEIALAAKSGATRVRIDIPLKDLLPQRKSGGYAVPDVHASLKALEYSHFDALVEEAKQQDMPVHAILHTESLPGLGMTPGLYGKYAKAVAKRYEGKIWGYEFGNEVNAFKLWPWDYVEYVKAASIGIRDVDKKAQLSSAGLITFGNYGLKYLQKMYQYEPELDAYIDMLAVHPYGFYPFLPWMPYGSEPDLHQPDKFSQESIKHGGKGLVLLSEAGVPPTIPAKGGVTEEVQASDTLKVIRYVVDRASPVEMAFFYDAQDRKRDSSNPEDNFGACKKGGEPKLVRKIIKQRHDIFVHSRNANQTSQ